MKWCVLFFLTAVLCPAQQRQREVFYDGFGQAAAGASTTVSVSGKASTITRSTQSINGRSVPVERVEERLIREDAQGRVVERLIRRYDPNGNPAQAEKVLLEEQKRPDGSITTRTTVYRGDVNGNLTLAERSLAESHKAGDVITTAETIEKPSINGSLQTAEKRDIVVRKSAGGETKNTVVFRRNDNGQMVEFSKEVADRKDTPGGAVENVATYETAALGRMTLSQQTVKKTVKAADGSEQIELDVYQRDVPGRTSSAADPKPQLREQQIIERHKSSAGVTETVAVRRPTLADPNRLGPAQKLSERVCTGKCE